MTALTLPAHWNRHRHPRRTSPSVPAYKPRPGSAATVADLLARHGERIRSVLANDATPDDVRTAGEAWLDGDRAAAPALGAAAVAACCESQWAERDRVPAFADDWITRRGVVFAAEAATELLGLEEFDPDGRVRYSRRTAVALGRSGDQTRRTWGYGNGALEVVLRVRAALAAAPADVYAAAVERLAGYRAATLMHRIATSVLVPTETAWVAADVPGVLASRSHQLATALLTAAGPDTPDHDRLAVQGLIPDQLPMITTYVEGVGADAAPALLHWLDRGYQNNDKRGRLLSAIRLLPSDAAMAALIERRDQKLVPPALIEAARRFPERAVRLLAADPATADLLRAHVQEHPEVAAAVVSTLDAEAAARVQAVLGGDPDEREAPAEAVPAILVTPPWTNRKKAPKPVVVADLTRIDEPSVHEVPASWAETGEIYGEPGCPPGSTVEQWAAQVRSGEIGDTGPAWFFLSAPEAVARPVLREWLVRDTWEAEIWMRPVIARWGVEALPAVLDLARREPATATELIMPYASADLAELVADWLTRLKRAQAPALRWLLRHPETAARALIPAALGPAGPDRRRAERVLRVLAHHGTAETVRTAAKAYGPEAADGVEAILAVDPLTVLPARLPAPPAWAPVALLPTVQLRDGAGTLPAAATGHLLTMLAVDLPAAPYAGIAAVRDACTPASLARFTWDLFERWLAAGAPAKESWALTGLATHGDDETVRRLTPLILAWPGEGGHHRAVTGVGVLAGIGTDVALMHLHRIAQRAKFGGLKAAANAKMAELAADLGLTADQLGDRLVPDFGLDASGSMTLDYGPRRFTVGFDEQLRPYVTDAGGKRLTALPKPGAKDDPDRAPVARATFTAVKKDVRTIDTEQIKRLRVAMVRGRRWTAPEFRRYFVEHPLMWHIVRRLIWAVHDDSGRVVTALRVAEDRSYADVHDDPITLPDDATLSLAHPMRLGADLAAWAETFADYEILQPFPQLTREVFGLTGEEAAATALTRFAGKVAASTTLSGLEYRGWRRGPAGDNGWCPRLERVAGGLTLSVTLDPGMPAGHPGVGLDQTIGEVHVRNGRNRVPLGEYDPVEMSEALRDLTGAVS